MILKTTPQDSDPGNTGEYFDSIRNKNYEASLDGVREFVVKNADKLNHRQRKPLRKWQWALAVLFPMLVILACTKTEHSEPVGNTVAFSVPANDDEASQGLEKIVSGLQTIVVQDKQRPGYLSYTCFIPAQSNPSASALMARLQGVKGISGLTSLPVSAQVKESLLSQLGYKIFRTHIDASGMGDEEMQRMVTKQLRDQGITDISVTVIRNEKGLRTLALHPAKDASNYSVDVSIDEKGTRMVLKEEKRTRGAGSNDTTPQPDFTNMSDAQVINYLRQQNRPQLRDEDVHITRTATEIAISIKDGDKKEELMRFRLK